MRRIGIFYYSTKPSPGRQEVYVPGIGVFYIRVEESAGAYSLDDALNEAEPQEEETLMNTHFLD